VIRFFRDIWDSSLPFTMHVLSFFVLFQLFACTWGDVYMHNPRGSNDRNCERNVNRDNGNRLFNSQNNNNGGYACPRAVGDGTFQSEDGTYTFSQPSATGPDKSYVQNKRMYYYSGSILPIEWTSQHGCGGNSKVSCEIILQYACEDTLDPKVDDFWPWVQNKGEAATTYRGKQHFRDTANNNIAAPRDGVPRDVNDAATDTIPDTEASAIPNTVETRRFGMQESRDYYDVCQHTERNKGLYTADQIVRRNDQRGTRQNPNGDRHGFECPEERDYYPWWAPSPWIDIAVLSDSAGDNVCYRGSSDCTKRCNFYMNNTMNWNRKGYCDVDHSSASSTVTKKINDKSWNSNQWPNNPTACAAKTGFKWYEVSHADNLILGNNFVCAKTQFSRVNQLGNARGDEIVSQSSKYVRNDTNIFMESSGIVATHIVEGVNANRFLWTVPDIPTMVNPSSYWTSTDLQSAYKSCVLRIRYNISSADFQSWPIAAVDAGTHHMVDSANNSRTKSDPVTPLTQDPYVYIGPGDSDGSFGKMFVRLAVNTNQYARTFQDRSYVFSIKPRPTTNDKVASDNNLDSPEFDWAAISDAINKGGKIYNVNVRGKRGNIVQVYPSVEYDFVPNALALKTNDMIHFQWTGSDYNPRRGCNDGEGGPPDLNTYFTDANANLNSRADRSNLIFTRHMGENVPKDYLGYNPNTQADFATQSAKAKDTVSNDIPCYDPTQDSADTKTSCYAQVMRLAYLNQQLDVGSRVLRQNKKCLTQAELEAIEAINKDVAENHPLNCAKMNAKPFPYFDGGIMIMKKWGWFPFFSSRNNNFSNRQQIGVICVGPQCKVNNSTGVLQDQNPAVNGKSITRAAAPVAAPVASPVQSPTDSTITNEVTSSSIITAESFAATQTDNDNTGDGVLMGCAASFGTGLSAQQEQQIGLALGLLAVGLFTSWLAYFLYNRYQARLAAEPKFRGDTSWQNADTKAVTASDYRPKSMRFWQDNPSKSPKSGAFQPLPPQSVVEMNEPHTAREEGALPAPPPVPERKAKHPPLPSGRIILNSTRINNPNATAL